MEVCPTCNKVIETLKLLKCRFCEKNCCCLSCLVKHASVHLGSKDTSLNLVNSLRRRQSDNLTEQYLFITSGNFKDKINFDKKYDYKNFTKVIEDIFPKELGSGSFGRVFLVSHNETKKLYALKEIDKRKLLVSYGKCDIIYNEINIHSKLDHENIIKLYNVHEDNENINIIMEYAEHGNLYELIKKENGFPEYKAFQYFIQVINAVYYLHTNNIIHRDIKPENILIGDDNKIKLCDFGWAKELTLENRSTFCGTVEYMAPEIVENENYDYSVDIWSLGILLYELLYGHSPFKANSTKNVILNIKTHELTYDDKNKNVSNSCKDLIKKLLNNNPQKRYKIKDILEHPFIKKHLEKYLSTFKKKPTKLMDEEEDNLFEIRRANTKYLTSKNQQKLFQFNIKNISPKLISSTSKKVFIKPRKLDFDLSPKQKKSSSKQLEILEKFSNSLQTQLEKAKKTIENMSFKNSKHCTFEDFRDSQFSSARKNTPKIYGFEQLKENIDINHPKKIKKQISSKVNNIFSTKINFNEVAITDFDTKNRSNSSKKSKQSNNSKGIIIENDFEDIVEGEEQKAAIERLNKAFERFGKENLNTMN